MDSFSGGKAIVLAGLGIVNDGDELIWGAGKIPMMD
jgi:hypothetical protein